jgi:hypothetical protein
MGPSPTTASETSLMTLVSAPRGRMWRSSRRMASASSRTTAAIQDAQMRRCPRRRDRMATGRHERDSDRWWVLTLSPSLKRFCRSDGAEADGNRTRLRAFARTPILKACPALSLPSGL